MNKSPKLYLQSVGAILFAFITSSFILFHAPALQAAEVFIQNPSIEQQKIGQLTEELNRLIRQYRSASTDELALIEQQLNTVASERQQLLTKVADSDPETVLKYALPEKVQAQFPPQVQAKFEQWIHAQGELEIFYEDHDNPQNNRLRYFLKQEKTRFKLAVSGDKLPTQTSGHSVWIKGVLVSDETDPVITTSDEQVMLAADGSGDPDTSSAPSVLDYTIGEQRTAVFLVNFQDQPFNQPWSKAEISERFFTEISDFFWENSYQQTWLTGDVFGWYTVPFNSTDPCTLNMTDEVDSAATKDNIDLSHYQRIVYIFPQNTCTWAGYATVGGAQTRSWINNSPFSNVPTHELGHNLGLLHSQGLNCDGDVTETNCLHITYGDSLDTMGGNPGHFNAYQKERLGWLNQYQSPPLLTVQQAGTYSVELFETTSSNTKALKVYKDIDPNSGLDRWYYIEYRQPVGVDEFFAISPFMDTENISNGLTIHMGTEGQADRIYLLDMTPESTSYSGDSADLWDPALVAGNSYTDSHSGLTITTEYTDSQMATFYVSYDNAGSGSLCSHAAPIMSVSSSESQWVAAGTKVDFLVELTNQDSSSCSSATFNITAATPSGWNASNPQLTLAPGEKASIIMSVSSADDAIDDFYDITLTASNTDKSNYNSTIQVTYVVSNGNSNSVPNAVNDSVIMTTVEPITINVLANDSDPDGDAIYISSLGSAAKGDVSVNATGTVIYTPAKRFKNADTFTYTISDGQASDTATVSLTLEPSATGGEETKGGGNGGKGGGKPSK